jgi:hypothetical protein
MMEVLPHLHFPEGTILDYYQCGTELGSYPKFYVRKEEEPRFPDNATAFSDARPAEVLDTVAPEFSQEGVWELLLLEELGAQFGLRWHANYIMRKIIYNMEEFFSGKYFGKDNDCFFSPERLSGSDKTELLSWDVEPKVELTNGRAVVKYCIFAPFRGFFQVRRAVEFDPKLSIEKPQILEKVSYNCGILF